MSDRRLPPADLEPEQLFRLLARAPRPVLDLEYRVPRAPAVALSVRAVTWLEELAAIDAAMRVDANNSRVMARHLVATALLADGQPAFRSAHDVGRLLEHELDGLVDAVYGALAVIAPSRARSNIERWRERILAGASHPSNLPTAKDMHDCCDFVVAGRVHALPRPERYFGLAPVVLTEGQKMVFHAACAAVESMSGTSGRRK